MWLIKSVRSKVLVEAYGTSTKECNRVWSQLISQSIDRYSLRAYNVPNTAIPDCKSQSLGEGGGSRSYLITSFCELKQNKWSSLDNIFKLSGYKVQGHSPGNIGKPRISEVHSPPQSEQENDKQVYKQQLDTAYTVTLKQQV